MFFPADGVFMGSLLVVACSLAGAGDTAVALAKLVPICTTVSTNLGHECTTIVRGACRFFEGMGLILECPHLAGEIFNG